MDKIIVANIVDVELNDIYPCEIHITDGYIEEIIPIIATSLYIVWKISITIIKLNNQIRLALSEKLIFFLLINNIMKIVSKVVNTAYIIVK